MSFLTESIVRQMAVFPRAIAINAPRTFSTSIYMRKTATETAKDGLKAVDRKVSDKIVVGIDAATSVTSKAKRAAENVTRGDVAAKAEELKGQATGKAQELKGEAAGKAQEMKGEAKGSAAQAAGKVKGAADEAQSKL